VKAQPNAPRTWAGEVDTMAVTFAEARCPFGGYGGRLAAAGWVSLRKNNDDFDLPPEPAQSVKSS
jgi:hypothetical protein